MAKLAILAGISAEAGDDGSRVIFVNFDGKTYPLTLNPESTPILLRQLQREASALAEERGDTLELFQLQVSDIALAHQNREVGLLVSTDQLGEVVLRFDDHLLERLRLELDRMMTYRSAPPNAH
jgi:hypothetical protein